MSTLHDRIGAALAASNGTPPLYPSDDRQLIAPDDPLVAAAVLVAITDRAEPGVILTLRTDNLRRHAGQIAFPGGRVDPEDSDAAAAALREAQEELALDPASVRLIGEADRYRTVTGYEVTPVVGLIAADPPLIANPAEVADWFEAPLGFLMDPANHVERTADWQGKRRPYLEINWQGRRIWGATAAMLANLSRRLAWS